MKKSIVALIIAASVAMSAMGCVGVIRTGPPPERVEAAPAAPYQDGVWIAGHWDYRNGTWVWAPGYWTRRPYPGAVWVPGHWRETPNGWRWVQGRWRG
jgi:hypothetical protein